jgi:hypothetical protein
MSARAEPMVVLAANEGAVRSKWTWIGPRLLRHGDGPRCRYGRRSARPLPHANGGSPANAVIWFAIQRPELRQVGQQGEPDDSSDARNGLRAAQRLREGDSPRPCRRCSSCAGTLWTMRVGDDLPNPCRLAATVLRSGRSIASKRLTSMPAAQSKAPHCCLAVALTEHRRSSFIVLTPLSRWRIGVHAVKRKG